MNLRLASLLVIFLGACTQAPEPPSPYWKGNLHTHSLWSDGDDFPEMIISGYAGRGYDFVALSDHNTLAEGEKWIPVLENHRAAFEAYLEAYGEPWVQHEVRSDTLWVRLKTFASFQPRLEVPGQFVIIQAEEITDSFEGKPLHVNASNVQERIDPQGGKSVVDVLQRNVDAVYAQRRETGQPMIPHVNHPNFGWAVQVEDLMALQHDRFFEVYNGHPLVHNEGDADHPGTERMWDLIQVHRLEQGDPLLYGLAVDDAHNYHAYGPQQSNPGRGWVMVQADTLTAAAVIEALERGDFYATSGVELQGEDVSDDAYQLHIAPQEGVTYRTQFIGARWGYEGRGMAADGYPAAAGEVLAVVEGIHPTYTFVGDEMYVRAKVISSRVKENPYQAGEVEVAWTQPVALLP